MAKPKTPKPRAKAEAAPSEEQDAGPVLKWAGGKRSLLPALRERVPATFGAYHEPFIGGGALFFSLAPQRAHISDLNDRLVRTYRGLAADVDEVIKQLKTYPYNREFFDQLKAKDIDGRPDTEVAAWMIYLNKTGFNGLYRVNSKNGFNVPFGKYAKAPNYCDETNLRAAAKRLAKVNIRCEPFEHVLTRAKANDFVYFDPPYVPIGKGGFTSYTGVKFGNQDHEHLATVARKLKAKGVSVLLSNADLPVVREMYEGFRIDTVMVPRSVNSRGSARGVVAEVLIS